MLLATLFLSLGSPLAQAAEVSDAAVVSRALELVEDRYLRIEELDPVDAFLQAAEAAEDAVPWLIVDQGDDGSVVLRHGMTGVFAELSLSTPDLAGLEAGLAELQAVIEAQEAEVPADVDLVVELLRGVSRALDRHSVVLAKRRLARFDERIKGRLTGIGARIGLVDGHPTIKDVFLGGPGQLGGLERGDVILRVDGYSTVGMSISQVVGLIRGPEETEVSLRLKRVTEDGEEELTLVFTRAEVAIPNLSWHMRPSGVGVVKIDHFSEQSSRLLRAALTDLRDPEGPPLRVVAIDLRGNSGGSMTQACRVADMFLEEGVVLLTGGRGGAPVRNLLREYRAHPEENEPDVPVVVLTDPKSASASEIVAGALVELDRGVVIGERTFGKGTVQKLYTLRDGETNAEKVRFKLTVAEYQVAGDTPIVSGVGIEPDLLVEQAVFRRGGVELPLPPPEEQRALVVAVEREGWREGVELPDAVDPLLELVDRYADLVTGSSRQAGLVALERLRRERTPVEEAALRRIFSYRDLDWAPAEEPDGHPEADVTVEIVDPPVAGSRVEVRATVANHGASPLYQVRVHLSAEDRRLPWNDLTLPVGFLPPGEEAIGSAMVLIPSGMPDRADEVTVTLLADQRVPLAAEPQILEVRARPAPPLEVRARLEPLEDHHRVELHLSNTGAALLTGVRARLSWTEESGVEILDERGGLPVLSPGATERVDLGLRLDPELDLEVLPLELEVDAEVYGEVLELVVPLPRDGSEVHLQPPVLLAQIPTVLPRGPATFRVRAEDEGALEDLRVYVGKHKVAWRAGEGRVLEALVPVEVGPGTTSITAVATDDQGVSARRTWYVYGQHVVAAVDEHGEDLPEGSEGD